MGQRRFKVDLDQPEEAFERIAENFLQGGQQVFGEKFNTRRKPSPTISTRS